MKERGMMKEYDAPPPQSATTNRERLAPKDRPSIMEEMATKADDLRTNMARLKELRLAKETRADQTELMQDLELAERHIAESKDALKKQEALIRELERKGLDAEAARSVLGTMRQTQARHEQDRERILGELQR
jgi:hypothetical protein